MANKKPPAAVAPAAKGEAALDALKRTEPTVGQALQFLLPVLTPHRPGSTVFTALVGIAFDGGAAHG